MNQNLQPGMHPDADQLSVFVEGAATTKERERMLSHLAECGECREIVFLMQRPVEATAAANQAPPESVWQRWLLPLGLTGSVAACVLVAMLIYVRPRTEIPKSVGQIAEVQAPPQIGTNDKTFAPNSSAGTAAEHKSSSGRDEVAMKTIPPGTAGAPGAKRPNPENPRAAAGTAMQGSNAVLPSISVDAVAGAANTPLEPDAQSALNSPVVQQLPLRGRNLTSVQPAPGVPAGTAQNSAGAEGALPALKVERQSGQDQALSGVSGRVTDASGAVVPQATVALRDTAGTTRQAATGADGSFQLTGVPAGHYDLTVTAPGFARNQQSIDLKPSELAMLQPVLNVGAATQTVEVSSSAAVLETESVSVSSIAAKLPSRLAVAATVSLGKRILTLDSAGSLFLSRNAGKSWKQVKPQWTGKPVRIHVATPDSSAATAESKASSPNGAQSVFQLTTDSGTEWTSEDGTHWRQQ